MTAPDAACPECGTPTPLSHNGHRALCLTCTELEIGVSVRTLRERATERLQKGRR